jgi:hypothetical protein
MKTFFTGINREPFGITGRLTEKGTILHNNTNIAPGRVIKLLAFMPIQHFSCDTF